MKTIVNVFVVLAVFCLVLCTVPVAADEEFRPGLNPIQGLSIPSIHESAGYSSPLPLQSATSLPVSYDLRDGKDGGYVTPVKDQSSFGTCWAFAIISSLESNAIKQGYETVATADFSELQLAYFLYNRDGVTVGDVLPELSGLAGDDVRLLSDETHLTGGGNELFGTYHLATGIGIVPEEEVPYTLVTDILDQKWDEGLSISEAVAEAGKYTVSPEYAVSKNSYILSDALFVSIQDRDEIKQLLMEKGSGAISYYISDSYYNQADYLGTEDTWNYYQDIYTEDSQNHVVSLIGWDDHYPKENFITEPERDGAWLCKNSYGTTSNNNGYFWLSYEDTSLSAVYFYEVRPASEVDTIYQYDGGVSDAWSSVPASFAEGGSIAGTVMASFTAEGQETITDVSFVTMNPNVSYVVLVMREDGSVAATDTGMVTYCGYHTVSLSTPVVVSSGEEFAVGVRYSVPTNTINWYRDNELALPHDASFTDTWVKHVSSVESGQTAYAIASQSTVDGVDIGANFRIKAFGTSSAPAASLWNGAGTEDDPFQISDADDLVLLAEMVNGGKSYAGKYFVVTDDIDLSSVCGEGIGNWEPIGYYTSDADYAEFCGIFDGQNHAIKNLYINDPDGDNLGLFGYLGSAWLKNIRLENVDITGYSQIGGLAAEMYLDGTSALITDCQVSGEMTVGGEYAGGLLGYSGVYAGKLVVLNCTSSVQMSGGSNVGGLIGYMVEDYDSVLLLSNCTADGDAAGYQYIGGLMGTHITYNGTALMTDCFASGNVAGTAGVGGLISMLGASNSTSLLLNSTASGAVSGSQSGSEGVGGLIGGTLLFMNGVLGIENCTSSGYVNGGHSVGGFVGLNTVASCTSANDGILSITDSHATGNVTGNYNLGGFVGMSEAYRGGTIFLQNSTYAGTVTSTLEPGISTGAVGGLVGYIRVETPISQSAVVNCSTSGTVTFENAGGSSTDLFGQFGGLVGETILYRGGVLTVSECWSDSDVLCDGERIGYPAEVDHVGGLVGANVVYETGNLVLVNNQVTGSVFGDNSTGGLVGMNYVDDGVSSANIAKGNAADLHSAMAAGSQFANLLAAAPRSDAGVSSLSSSTVSETQPAVAEFVQYVEKRVAEEMLSQSRAARQSSGTSAKFGSTSSTPENFIMILRCSVSGSVSGYDGVGGLVGVNDAKASGNTLMIGVGNSTALNPSVTGSANVGRILGFENGGASLLKDNYALETMSCTATDGISVSSAAARTQSFYEGLGFDFVKVWKMDSSISPYPVFKWQQASSSGGSGDSGSTDTRDVTNAETAAVVEYVIEASTIDKITAPTFTRGKLTITLNEKVIVKDETGRDIDATVDSETGKVILTGDLGDAKKLTVTFVGRKIGDTNDDNTINVLDNIRIAYNCVGTLELTDTEVFYANINGDGQINVLDCILLAQYAIGHLDANYEQIAA